MTILLRNPRSFGRLDQSRSCRMSVVKPTRPYKTEDLSQSKTLASSTTSTVSGTDEIRRPGRQAPRGLASHPCAFLEESARKKTITNHAQEVKGANIWPSLFVDHNLLRSIKPERPAWPFLQEICAVPLGSEFKDNIRARPIRPKHLRSARDRRGKSKHKWLRLSYPGLLATTMTRHLNPPEQLTPKSVVGSPERR